MLRVRQVSLPLDDALTLDEALLRVLSAMALGVPAKQVRSARLHKRSVDARDKTNVRFVLTVDVSLAGGEPAEQKAAGNHAPNRVAFLPGGTSSGARLSTEGGAVFNRMQAEHPEPHPMDDPKRKPGNGTGRNSASRHSSAPPPLVVGAGPAGLFCALTLARRGLRPILIERGQPVEQRQIDVEAFETQGRLNPESNVLFGEGGAGAFSDGKLTCGLNHPLISTILHILVSCGAPEDILIAQKPHIGTDLLRKALVQFRQKLIALGVDLRFGHCLTGLRLQAGRVTAAFVTHENREDMLETDTAYLAIGHSARDTYAWLHGLGMPMQAKPFAVGVRIEHLQSEINKAQYGRSWPHPALPPAEYKLNVPTPDGRGAYTFCMCPGGRVVGAMHEPGTLNVNGMSLHARDGPNANAALLVGVRPADCGSGGPLAGLDFQRRMEEAAYTLTGCSAAPCQRTEDFLQNTSSKSFGDVLPSFRPGVIAGDVSLCLPDFVTANIRYALPRLNRLLKGFDHPDALLTGPETRSSSPVRLLRNERRESPISGLFPIGEGAGYAGGIISAALDGMTAALGPEQEDIDRAN
ncbi:MAG: FAD-binding protein [Clostridia bacterium]|nr:FAD-binding protein [Clostridia bacterium]